MPARGRAPARPRTVRRGAGIEILLRFLQPAAIYQQNRRVGRGDKWCDDVIAIAAADDDVLEQELVVGVELSRHLELLEWLDVDAVVPGRVTGVDFEVSQFGTLLEATARLPGAETHELYDQDPAYQVRQVASQGVFPIVDHVILHRRFNVSCR